jgi:hypothetical protein
MSSTTTLTCLGDPRVVVAADTGPAAVLALAWAGGESPPGTTATSSSMTRKR